LHLALSFTTDVPPLRDEINVVKYKNFLHKRKVNKYSYVKYLYGSVQNGWPQRSRICSEIIMRIELPLDAIPLKLDNISAYWISGKKKSKNFYGI